MAMTDEELLLQMKILTEKADSSTNPNMVYKSNKILNKGLNPDYYSGNDAKIVNILNNLFAADEKTSTVADNIANKVNSILKDTDTSDGQAVWEQLQNAMGKSTIIDGLNDLYAGKHVDKVLGVSEDDINKVLSVAKDDNGNLIIKAVDQIASEGPEANITLADLEYTNRYVSSITNAKGALDYIINKIVNEGFDGGLGGGTIIGEITWDMIDDRPAYVADTIELTSTHLELKEGKTVVSSVQLANESDIDSLVASLDEYQQ
jgi:hypothetical protein